jgi:hypothetical protein
MKGFDKDCAAGFKKYEFSQCRNCRIKECRVKTHYLEQKAYPVVIISHQRLFMHSEFNSDLHEFETWVDEKGVVRKRQLLLIDEKPVFTVTDCVDSNRLNGLLNEVKALESRFKAEGLASEVEGAKNVLEKVMDDFKEPGIGYFDPQERFRFSKEFKSIWKIHGSEWFHRLPEIVEYLINEGGVVERTIQHHVKLLCSHKVEVAWENYKTVIFDGTSDIDRSYTDEYRYLPGIEPVQYPNLTLNVCNRGNLSRTGIKRRDVNHFIDKLSADCASLILSRPEDRFYIVSYKEHESAFRASLRSKLGDEPYSRVEMDHFGNTKGKNDRRDCTCIILLGLLHKGESHYVAKYSSVYGRAGDLTVNNIRHSRKFIDPHLSQFIRLEQVAELAQEIYRTAIRRHGTRNVDVFLFSRDNELVEDLKAYFPGCKDGEWKALNSCPGAKGAMDLIDILKTELVEKGRQTITKRELKGMMVKGLKYQLKNKDVRNWLVENGFVETNRRIEAAAALKLQAA